MNRDLREHFFYSFSIPLTEFFAQAVATFTIRILFTPALCGTAGCIADDGRVADDRAFADSLTAADYGAVANCLYRVIASTK